MLPTRQTFDDIEAYGREQWLGELAQELKGKGNVVVFTIAGQPNTDERLKGMRDSLADKPGINFTEVIDVKGDALGL